MFRFELNRREALYRYCSERGVPHRRCGKLVVASSDLQLPALIDLHKRAEACGVGDVRLLGAEEAREMEPEVLCTEVTAITRLCWRWIYLGQRPKTGIPCPFGA